MRFGGGLTRAQTVSIALCRARNVSNEPQVFLTIMVGGGSYENIASRDDPDCVAGVLRGEPGKRLGSWPDPNICGVAELAGKRAGCHRRTDCRPGRHGLYADLWHQRQRRGGRAATLVLVQVRWLSALQRCSGQPGGKSGATAEHHAAWARLPGIFKDLADLRSWPGDRLAGRSQDRQVERFHEHRARLGFRP